MHRAGINLRHMGRLRRLIKNPDMRGFILCAAMSRVLKHKLRNKMRRAVRTVEKQNADLASEVTCKHVGARVLNMILGQHPKSADFWQRSVVKSLGKRFPFILSPEEQATTYDLRKGLYLRVLVAVVITQSAMRLTSKASNAIFTDPTTVKLVSDDIEVILADAKFSPIITLLDAEVCRRMASEEKNRDLRLRLLESARAKLKQTIDALPSCAYAYRTVAQVNIMAFDHPESDPFVEPMFAGIYSHLQHAFDIEQTKATLLMWAQALELHAERLEKANGGPTPRASEMRALAASKRAQSFEAPRHHCDSYEGGDSICI